MFSIMFWTWMVMKMTKEDRRIITNALTKEDNVKVTVIRDGTEMVIEGNSEYVKSMMKNINNTKSSK